MLAAGAGVAAACADGAHMPTWAAGTAHAEEGRLDGCCCCCWHMQWGLCITRHVVARTLELDVQLAVDQLIPLQHLAQASPGMLNLLGGLVLAEGEVIVVVRFLCHWMHQVLHTCVVARQHVTTRRRQQLLCCLLPVCLPAAVPAGCCRAQLCSPTAPPPPSPCICGCSPQPAPSWHRSQLEKLLKLQVAEGCIYSVSCSTSLHIPQATPPAAWIMRGAQVPRQLDVCKLQTRPRRLIPEQSCRGFAKML